MSVTMTSGLRTAVAFTAAAASALMAPQTSAADITSVSGVHVASAADSGTRAIAVAAPRTVRGTANLCGSGYKLTYAERLPDKRRFGTLFTYQNRSLASCAVFDNNLGTKKYMKLKLCTNRFARCKTDKGNFSQYAGPVRVSDGFCAKVTAIMKNSRNSSVALIDRVLRVPPCD